jgi:hypothetical protein
VQDVVREHYNQIVLRLCEVAVNIDGRRYAQEFEARSAFHAACYFCGLAIGTPMLGILRLPDDIIYEVRIVGEQRVYRVRHRRMMEWANEHALRGADNMRGRR